ncbi:tRNA (adenosine(37)-N6)-threonylcarbamoyltransferase complex transferase subunit TsaD [Peptoniphilus sp. KCTC 25270]|uniref:tRNA (adenosine(37)-N6)-threonylcarbamoyltransferase complex transferase subunit TsaD n=1 Tax=Peptoniphilus sp. KCTC 25270 TaxID=2897414 RepID=UPI001E480495|nr:tRNA (adenosine(37)-N6)-threonylcarbamoyltransferase complex transferase subunit TsaD [Peptoniphilus sp. KCTC 25270]MCD1147618.1 tRNA (adenosine(37)-N6)-threonylcarbamoyltransferase complex transferase subunit TsaD [Peptoniphilus sp. KCTC 25270]
MITLGFESSCDETSVSIVKDGREVLSNEISSQIEIHRLFGGVVPEIASRKHVSSISPVLDIAMEKAGIGYEDIDLITATRGPGLIGALLVGLTAGRTLALALNKPFVGVNHIKGHICANYITHPQLEPPFVGLIVSGGHSYLIHVNDYVDFTLYGRTRDDAAGEAFDKVARAMGIGYPGGPIIDKLAKEGEPTYDLPRVWLEKDSYDFSFSGLKTAVLNELNIAKQKGIEIVPENMARSFQDAVVEVLVEKTYHLAYETGEKTIVLAGGVSANSALRKAMEERGEKEGFTIYYPDSILCTDNAAMIASAGYYEYHSKNRENIVYADPNLGLEKE